MYQREHLKGFLTEKQGGKDKSTEQIAEELEEEFSVIEPICKVASDFAPEYDVHEIYQALQMHRWQP